MSKAVSKTKAKSPPPPPRYPYVHLDVAADEVDALSDQLWIVGAAGIEERDASTILGAEGKTAVTLVASFADEASARAAVRKLPRRNKPRVEFVVGDEWRDKWQTYFKPTRIAQRLLLRPSWEEVRPKDGEVVLTIDPGRAFGSGIHATTRLVLREVDRRVRGGERVLDVGCGSGILSVAALLLGADKARAVDVDEAAVEASRDNARRNLVSSRLTVSTSPVERLRGEYDLVLANIRSSILVTMAPALIARMRKGRRPATLVLSGILVGEEQPVLEAFRPLELRLEPREGEWVALVLEA